MEFKNGFQTSVNTFNAQFMGSLSKYSESRITWGMLTGSKLCWFSKPEQELVVVPNDL